MHILTLLGSPRRKGNTAEVLGCFEQYIAGSDAVRPAGGRGAIQGVPKEAGQGVPPHTYERLNLIDYTVRPCLGCLVCQKVFDEPGCRQKDDALAIFARLRAADLIVYATPLYCWDFSSHLKLLMDRHFCMIKWDAPGGRKSLLAGKRAALLVTCGDAEENNADLIPVVFRRQMEAARCEPAGVYILADCPSTPGRLGSRPTLLAGQMAAELLV